MNYPDSASGYRTLDRFATRIEKQDAFVLALGSYFLVLYGIDYLDATSDAEYRGIL